MEGSLSNYQEKLEKKDFKCASGLFDGFLLSFTLHSSLQSWKIMSNLLLTRFLGAAFKAFIRYSKARINLIHLPF